MIINFAMKNYRSFRGTAELTMEAESFRNEKVVLTNGLSDRQILPVAGVFGANASGKSNVVKALSFFLWAANNADQNSAPIFSHPLLRRFLLDGNKDPVEFELEILSKDRSREYMYSFAIQDARVPSEEFTVLERLDKNRISRTIFSRSGTEITFDNSVEKDLKVFESALKLDNGILTLNRLANLVGYEIAKDFLNELKRITIIGGNAPYNIAELHKDENLKAKVVDIIKESDTCIKDISIQKVSVPAEFKDQVLKNPQTPEDIKKAFRGDELYSVSSIHQKSGGETVRFDFQNDESNGTNKLLGYAPFIIKTIESGGILIIDEIDASLHPFITAKIIETFLDESINQGGAQLVFTSHEEYLMSKAVNLRTDQIFIVDKGRGEGSSMTSLADYNIRNDAAIDKKYIESRLGGVPNVTSGGFEING